MYIYAGLLFREAYKPLCAAAGGGGRTDLCPDDCPQGPDGDRDAGPQL